MNVTDTQSSLMVHARLVNPPMPSVGEEAANAPSNCKCETNLVSYYVILWEYLYINKWVLMHKCRWHKIGRFEFY